MKMNTILKSFFLFGMSVLMAVGAMAQAGQPGQITPQERAERQAAYLKKQLALTEEQALKLDEINKSSAEAMMSLRGDQGLDRQARMEKMRGLRNKREAAIVAILTDQQKQKYKSMLQSQENRQVQRTQQRRSVRRDSN